MIKKIKRYGLLTLGHICLLLGVLGVFLPILPTTPFILAASFCYARSSERFQKMLHENKYFGPPLKDWEQSKGIRTRSKIIAIVSIVVGICASLLWVPIAAVRVVLVTIGITISFFIYTRPLPS